jgi:hypothetical protein
LLFPSHSGSKHFGAVSGPSDRFTAHGSVARLGSPDVVTVTPCSAREAATSQPMNTAPMTTAEDACAPARRSRVASASYRGCSASGLFGIDAR